MKYRRNIGVGSLIAVIGSLAVIICSCILLHYFSAGSDYTLIGVVTSAFTADHSRDTELQPVDQESSAEMKQGGLVQLPAGEESSRPAGQ